MSSRIKSLYNLFKRPKEDMVLVIEALCYLLFIKLLLTLHNFNYLAKKYSLHVTQKDESKADNPVMAKKVGWAVERVSLLLPWEGLCLVKALSAQRMLVKRSLQGTIYMGVKNSDAQQLKAHAWLKYNELFLTGRAGHEEFTVVSKLVWDIHE